MLSFEGNAIRKRQTGYFLPMLEIDYNRSIDSRNIFDQPLRKNLRTHDNMLKIKEATTQLVPCLIIDSLEKTAS